MMRFAEIILLVVFPLAWGLASEQMFHWLRTRLARSRQDRTRP